MLIGEFQKLTDESKMSIEEIEKLTEESRKQSKRIKI